MLRSMTTRIGVLLLGLGLLAGTANAEPLVMIETNGIEVQLPSGWAQMSKGTATIIAPKKFKGRAIEIMSIKGMPPSTTEALQKILGDKMKVTMAKEIERNGAKVVIASATVTVGKDAATLDLLALPAAKGAVMMMSFVSGDQDPLLRKASAEVLLSARIAGPKLSVDMTPPTTKGIEAPPEQFVDAFKKMAPALETVFLLPRPLPIKFKECGMINAMYKPGIHEIWMCHELYTYFKGFFTKHGLKDKDLDETIRGALAFTFFHEFGHALHGELELPVTAKGEDAADELATLFLSQMGKNGVKVAFAGARWFALESEDGKGKKMNFLDEHSVDEQRMGSIMCLLYGSDKAKVASPAFMKKLGFDDRRLAKCTRDYQARYKAWNQLLEPYHRKAKKK